VIASPHPLEKDFEFETDRMTVPVLLLHTLGPNRSLTVPPHPHATFPLDSRQRVWYGRL